MTTLLMTVNFGRGDTPAHHRRSMNRVAAFAKQYDQAIIFTQEVGEGDRGYNEHSYLKALFPDYTYVAERSMTPILVKGFDVEKESIELAMKGIAHVSPARFVVKARVSRASKNAVKLVLLNLHPIQGAFTDPGQAFEAERLAGYESVWNMATEKGNVALKAGNTVIWGGDMNNPSTATMFKGEKVLVHHSLDVLKVAERDTKVTVLKTGHVNTGIDPHDAEYAIVTLSAA